jgi:lipid-A-disaccharide synthase
VSDTFAQPLPPFRLFVVTGEVSGDALAASFIVALGERLAPRPLELIGVGGPSLQRLGLRSIFPQTDIQLMGVLAVLKRLPRVLSRISQTAAAVIASKPDLLVTVDAQDFSARVARRVRNENPDIPIVHYVAPTVWAWRPGRARAIKPHVDALLALLPFEPEVFRRLDGPPTTYVGHPLLDMAAHFRPDEEERRMRANLAAPVILVLPGSRRSELKHLAGPFREALRIVAARLPHARFVLPAVPHLADAIEQEIAGWPIKPEVVRGDDAKHAAFRRARAALAASGTVTLELALAGVPLIGAYRGQALEAWVARRLIKTSSVLLCNLVLGRPVVPEYLQAEATGLALAEGLMRVLEESQSRSSQIEAFSDLDRLMSLPNGRSSASLAVDVALSVVARHRA